MCQGTATCSSVETKAFSARWLNGHPAAGITQFTRNSQTHSKRRVAGRSYMVARLPASLDKGSSEHQGRDGEGQLCSAVPNYQLHGRQSHDPREFLKPLGLSFLICKV